MIVLFHSSQMMGCNLRNINIFDIHNIIALYYSALFEYLVSNSFDSGSAIRLVEFDAEVFVWAAWIVTGSEEDSTAAGIRMILVQLPDNSRPTWRSNDAVDTDDEFRDSISCCHLYNELNGHIIVESAIACDHHGFTFVVFQ